MKTILAAWSMALAMAGGVWAADTAAPAPPAAKPAQVVNGPVLEATNVARYTYVRIKAGDEEIWAAGPQTAVAVGERVKLDLQIPMQDFWSSGLNRRFPLIYFVSAIEVEGRPATSGPRAAAPHGKIPKDAVHQGMGAALPAGHPDIGEMAKPAPAVDTADLLVGKVLQSLDAGRYTYIEVQQGKTTRWLAAPTIAVKAGEEIRFPEGMEMKEFKSDTLKRSFSSIYFVEGVFPAGD